MKLIDKNKVIDWTRVQQMFKKIFNVTTGKEEEKDVYPLTVVQAVFDSRTATPLDKLLGRSNNIFVEYAGTWEDTVKSIDIDYRRKGLIVTTKDLSGNIINKQFTDMYIDDNTFCDNNNWKEVFINLDSANLQNLYNNVINYLQTHGDGGINPTQLEQIFKDKGFGLIVSVQGHPYIVDGYVIPTNDTLRKYSFVYNDTTDKWYFIRSGKLQEIKTGGNITIDNIVTSTSSNPVSGSAIHSFVTTTVNGVTISQATSSSLGTIKIGYSANGRNYPVLLNGSGQAYVNVPWQDTNTTYNKATTTTDGLMSKEDKDKLDKLSVSGSFEIITQTAYNVLQASGNLVTNKIYFIKG